MEYQITEDIAQMDIDLIHQVISSSYWANSIPRETLERSMQNSLCFALLNSAEHTVGFARVITDKATFAYLADVFVLQQYRNNGLSKQLMAYIGAHPQLQGLRRQMLATRDAHGLYAQFGFEPVPNPEILMQKWQPNIYQDSDK
ncbi:GNAT family N-acetyltransferase [Shewanella waksmanii]|uniref:GNAT family N-acetyltransferase n=1 Tax=Shewanella waksmanii TaxID=213783 RepID=UPI00048E1FC6|nr:GNAT family N-acetyltransferase [Shewanella waksmanii]